MPSVHETPGPTTGATSRSSRPAYVVITPARNEATYIRETIDAMRAQTCPPMCWVIVDDGSTDDTARIAKQAATEVPWIRVVQRSDRGRRQAGSGVVEAFDDGLAAIGPLRWDYVVKLDADLSFDDRYFEHCLAEFDRDPMLGIGGGTCCTPSAPDEPEFRNEPRFHVRGPTKIYRRQCYEAIGGLVCSVGWDTIDQFKANMLGWRTGTFPHIRLIHHRPTGGAYGAWDNWKKNGAANYVAGYHPVFMVLKCVKRAVTHPGGRGLRQAAGLLYGFFGARRRHLRRVADRQLVRYVQREQWRSLLLRPSLWRP